MHIPTDNRDIGHKCNGWLTKWRELTKRLTKYLGSNVLIIKAGDLAGVFLIEKST